jgi:Flp pilus assembly protein TadG
MRDGQAISKTRKRRGPQDGATAVEFAMVAGPLFFMILSIIELALVFVVSTSLENATNDASRRIRTGEFQSDTAGLNEAAIKAAFRERICERMSFLSSTCADRLSVDVRVIDNFGQGGSADLQPGGAGNPIKSDGTYNDEDLTVAAGSQGQRVIARAFYRWPLLTPFLTELDRADGSAVLTATVIHQNEPFG